MAKMSIPILVDWESIKDYLEKADIVEVIRCKDCEYRCLPNQTHMPDMYPCKVWGKEVYPHEWCSRAERKEE